MISQLNSKREGSEHRSKRPRDATDDSETEVETDAERETESGVLTPRLLRAELAELTRVLSTKMEESVERLRQELGDMRQRVLDLEGHVERQGVELDELRSAVDRRDVRISELEGAVTELEMDRNRHFLVFDGPGVPPHPDDREPWKENVSETVVKTVRKYLPDIELAGLGPPLRCLAGAGRCLSSGVCVRAPPLPG
ncbi:hypothetical protein FJT64_010555 [Amphibalanus amphitrite]|uniref:t-SNARE coiled-coil homology domain-containing protein n=1 Tax=Amphibalanus amphitrite TaxID=1232801 RepID=A0A6A4VBU8_AMPAM|nr:hypothetical protein FJT64_010555 [Amphibalanus amphitrite]